MSALRIRSQQWLDRWFPIDQSLSSGLSSRAPVAVWLVAVAVILNHVATAHRGFFLGVDERAVWLATRAAALGRDPFDTSIPYVYLPSTLGLFAPFGYLPQETLKALMLALTLVGVPLAAALSVRLAGLPMTSWAAALLTNAVAWSVLAVPQFHYLNVMIVSIIAMPFILSWWRSGKWRASSWVIGFAIAVKPMLVPLAFFAALDRRWRDFAIMAGIPLVLSGVGLALAPDASTWFTEALPFLLDGEPGRLRAVLTSLLPIGLTAGWPMPVVHAVRLTVAISALVLAALLWKRRVDPTLRVVEPVSLVLLATFIAFSASLSSYLLLLLPMFACACRPSAISRNAVGWLALAAASSNLAYSGDDIGRASRRVGLGLLVLFIAWAWSAVRVLRTPSLVTASQVTPGLFTPAQQSESEFAPTSDGTPSR